MRVYRLPEIIDNTAGGANEEVFNLNKAFVKSKARDSGNTRADGSSNAPVEYSLDYLNEYSLDYLNARTEGGATSKPPGSSDVQLPVFTTNKSEGSLLETFELNHPPLAEEQPGEQELTNLEISSRGSVNMMVSNIPFQLNKSTLFVPATSPPPATSQPT